MGHTGKANFPTLSATAADKGGAPASGEDGALARFWLRSLSGRAGYLGVIGALRFPPQQANDRLAGAPSLRVTHL